jgi:hypothetical protein
MNELERSGPSHAYQLANSDRGSAPGLSLSTAGSIERLLGLD